MWSRLLLFISVDNPREREYVHDRTARDWSAFNRSSSSLRSVQHSPETHLHESRTVRLHLDGWEEPNGFEHKLPLYFVNRYDIYVPVFLLFPFPPICIRYYTLQYAWWIEMLQWTGGLNAPSAPYANIPVAALHQGTLAHRVKGSGWLKFP